MNANAEQQLSLNAFESVPRDDLEGYAVVASAHQNFRGGALGRDIPFIEKPLSANEIAHRVREVLDSRLPQAPGAEG